MAEGTVINDLLAQYDLTQIILESTQLPDCLSSFVDLIFFPQGNLYE